MSLSSISVIDFKYILQLQDEMNCLVDRNWRDNKNMDFPFAAIMECVEAMEDHLSWKWWSNTKKKINIHQLFLENVDIFHFVLSELLKLDGDTINLVITETIEYGKQEYDSNKSLTNINEKELISCYKDLIRCLAEYPLNLDISSIKYYLISYEELNIKHYINESLKYIIHLNTLLGYRLDDLFKYYVFKNALNKFRQQKGYIYGNYNRKWSEKLGFGDDNVLLEHIIKKYYNNNVNLNSLKELTEYAIIELNDFYQKIII